MSKRERGAGGWLGKASHRPLWEQGSQAGEAPSKGPGMSTSLGGSEVAFTWPAQNAVRPTMDSQTRSVLGFLSWRRRVVPQPWSQVNFGFDPGSALGAENVPCLCSRVFIHTAGPGPSGT